MNSRAKRWSGWIVLALTGCGSSGAVVDDTGTTAGETTAGESGDTGATEELTRIECILAAVRDPMYTCPDRVWPTTADRYRRSQVLFTDFESDVGYLWNDQSASQGDPPRVTEGPIASLGESWRTLFEFGSIAGVPTLGISLTETVFEPDPDDPPPEPWHDYAATLAFHEGFHFLSGQNNWSVPAGARNQPYPEPVEPRYLRGALFYELRRQLREDDSDLGAAAYWHARMNTDYENEAAFVRGVEITEGSAQFAEAFSAAIADLGCDASDADLVAAAVEHLDEFATPEEFENFNSFGEPYDLGVVSGLLMARAGVEGWKERVRGGETPLEVLLENVESVDQPDDSELQEAVEAAVEERNAEAGKQIDPLLAALDDPDQMRVALNFGWVEGSFGVGGFYYLPDFPNTPEVLIGFSATMTTPSGELIELAQTPVIGGLDNPCPLGANALVAHFPASALTVDADGDPVLATSTADGVSFENIAVTVVPDDNGIDWLCPTDTGAADRHEGRPFEFERIGPPEGPGRRPRSAAGRYAITR